ncbi:hypothetical protein BU16DRAFT_168514 [Lophium mytilinum]|uniref:Xylanolytic transcriptional activator regulatory domain-containing protein n=1 Tax=Lophium mytilinum TaxID=390894 RepID=A0A6A6QD41_9PEZI|nr:hypothetical protein BU16DRAFT_168514 [Lophium mytilinum]
MQSGGRKRVVSSCLPCYRKKQKATPQTDARSHEVVPAYHDTQSQDTSSNDELVGSALDWRTKRISTLCQGNDALAEMFGYVEHSESNTLALVRRLGLGEDEPQNRNRDIAPEAYDEIDMNIKRLPGRKIFDFLIQFYITEVHWMEQIVYAPWFLSHYQKWWNVGRLSRINDVEFAVLFIRICSYASQFLPSPSYTIDRIRGMPLADIRAACHDIAENLAAICVRLNARGTLLRAQHLLVLGLQWQCEGSTNAFWDALSNAARVAQRIGLHRGRAAWTQEMHEFDKEIRSRVYCNLYIWDSHLSAQLDCSPFFSASLTAEHLPRMHLTPDIDDADAPEDYSERLLQARLASFWRSLAPKQGAKYDATVAEERYGKFCSDFLPHLPPYFALEPSKEWDERLPKLPLQRQILHVAIFDFLCQNFRQVLLREPSQVQSLPAYKQVVVASQKRALAAAALKMLEGVAKLHALLGASYTRFAAVILPAFEAAVVLVSLLTMDQRFPGADLGDDGPLRALDVDPLGWEKAHLTRDRCYQATQQALARLEMLAEVSNMAKAGAGTLARLVANMPHSEAALDDSFAHYTAETFPGLNGERPD